MDLKKFQFPFLARLCKFTTTTQKVFIHNTDVNCLLHVSAMHNNLYLQYMYLRTPPPPPVFAAPSPARAYLFRYGFRFRAYTGVLGLDGNNRAWVRGKG